MSTWTRDNVSKYMPLDGYTIPWPKTPLTGYAHAGDAVPEMKSLTQIDGHSVEVILNGKDYFDRLSEEIEYLKYNATGGIFWIHGWYFQLFDHDSTFTLSGKSELPEALKGREPSDEWEVDHEDEDLTIGRSSSKLFTDLMVLSQLGVDVRVIGWLSPWIVKSEFVFDSADGIAERNLATLHSLISLRKTNQIPANNIIFNTVTHPLGGAHAKFVIAGNNQKRTMFTGGIDAAASRNDRNWPDVAVAVQGNAATQGGKFFMQIWNEISKTNPANISFQSVEEGTTNVEIAAETFPTHFGESMAVTLNPLTMPNTADIAVQMYRTLPVMKFRSGFVRTNLVRSLLNIKRQRDLMSREELNALREIPFVWTKPLSIAPNGCFEFKVACYKAIKAAEKYIFIMDQDATNFELAKWINKRIKELNAQNKQLKVIIGTAIVEVVEEPPKSKTYVEYHKDKQVQLNLKLTAGLSREAKKQIVWAHYGTHGKVILVDDVWASIGSANFMRRSFYTDFEMGVGIMHETWVRDFRKALWTSMCMANSTMPTDVDQALGIWSQSWRNAVSTTYACPVLDPDKVMVLQPNADMRQPGAEFGYAKRRTEDPDSNDII